MKNEMSPGGWIRKFRLAFSGLFWAIGSEGSFSIHLPAAALVISLAYLMDFELARWSVLLLTIGCVLTAELLNTAMESMAKAVSEEENEHIKRALDVASGAVLTICIFAVIVGVFLFWGPFWRQWDMYWMVTENIRNTPDANN